QLAASERDELVALVRALLRLLEHRADAPDVQLVVHSSRLERRRLLRQDGVAPEHADHLELVLRMAFVVLLLQGLPDPRMRRDVDARTSTVDARPPGTL